MYTIKWSVMQYVVIRPGLLAVILALTFNRSHKLLTSSGIPRRHHYRSLWRALSAVILPAICTSLSHHYWLHQHQVCHRSCKVVPPSEPVLCFSVALYGLILFYSLTHSELEGRRPLAKFLCIKGMQVVTFRHLLLISMFFRNRRWVFSHANNSTITYLLHIVVTFYQDFIVCSLPTTTYHSHLLTWPQFSTLQSYGVIKGLSYKTTYPNIRELNALLATKYWTATNIADGLNALATCIEVNAIIQFYMHHHLTDVLLKMVFFALFMIWAYSATEHSALGNTSIFRPLIDRYASSLHQGSLTYNGTF